MSGFARSQPWERAGYVGLTLPPGAERTLEQHLGRTVPRFYEREQAVPGQCPKLVRDAGERQDLAIVPCDMNAGGEPHPVHDLVRPLGERRLGRVHGRHPDLAVTKEHFDFAQQLRIAHEGAPRQPRQSRAACSRRS